MRTLVQGGLSALLLLGNAFPAGAVDLVRPEETLLAMFTLETQVQTELALLDRLDARFRANQEERDRYRVRIDRLYQELDAMWAAPEDKFDAELAAQRDDELERLEKAQILAWDEGRRLRREMLAGRARIRLLRDRVNALAKTLPTDVESLTGYWDVLLLTGQERGVFFLVQSGAVLSGEYALEGGFRGSLQGTYVDGQVVLHRIDTRLGRVMDLDGQVSADGEKIRGTWRRYDLSSGKPASGAWSAARRPRTPPEGEPEGEGQQP